MLNLKRDTIIIYHLESFHGSDGSRFQEKRFFIVDNDDEIITKLTKEIPEFKTMDIHNSDGPSLPRIKIYKIQHNNITDITNECLSATEKMIRIANKKLEHASLLATVYDLQKKADNILMEITRLENEK